jgi:5-methylcytosine-specific restriction endonuclease McrA
MEPITNTRSITTNKLTQGSREWNGDIRRKRSNTERHTTLEKGRYWDIEQSLGKIFQEKPLTTELDTSVWNEIQTKLSSYRQQDIRQKRLPILEKETEKESEKDKDKDKEKVLITPQETAMKLLEQKLLCYYCKDLVKLGTTIVRDPEQWTLERKDNRFPHTNENCVIACLRCNLRRNTKVHSFFKKSFGVVVKKESD